MGRPMSEEFLRGRLLTAQHGSDKEKGAVSELTAPRGWRWRELNPRPREMNQGFSGCS